jgi:transcriptional regulator with GAF, ATPase, and Fis domain
LTQISKDEEVRNGRFREDLYYWLNMRILEETERNQILKTLSTRYRIEGKDGAAAILGRHPSSLRAGMHKLGIVPPQTKEPD